MCRIDATIAGTVSSNAPRVITTKRSATWESAEQIPEEPVRRTNFGARRSTSKISHAGVAQRGLAPSSLIGPHCRQIDGDGFGGINPIERALALVRSLVQHGPL